MDSTRLLNDGARALAHGNDLDATLRAILVALCDALDVGSSAIFAADPDGGLTLIASTGLDGERAGIQAAADLAAVALERHLPRT